MSDPYDLAHDLFGHPPRPAVVCPTCDRWAEPFAERRCWLCVNTDRRFPRPPLARPDPVPDTRDHERRVAEHAERVARELAAITEDDS